jgi:hypothetical protein
MDIIDGKNMKKIGRNDPCPCRSGMKYKKCCGNKNPRERIVLVGSPVPLSGLHYDKDKMESVGLDHEGNLIQPKAVISQTHYIGESGNEKIISRVQDKVIANEADLHRYLTSSFDIVIGVDTNTSVIGSDDISAAYIIHCDIQGISEDGFCNIEFPSHGVILFRNCPPDLHPEKFGWMQMLNELYRDPRNKGKRIGIITDHDMSNHKSYIDRTLPLFKDIYLPSNVVLLYGKGDGAKDTMLNVVVHLCDKKSKEVLNYINLKGFYEQGNIKVLISQIHEPKF